MNKKNIFLIIKIGIVIFLLLAMINFENTQKVEHSTFVSAIGIDKSKDGKFLITFQIVPPQITNQNSTDLDKYYTTTIEAETIEKAASLAQNYISSLINFSHTRAIIFSKEVAEQGCKKFLEAIVNSSTYNYNIFIMICESSSQKFLESMSKNIEINPISYYNIIYTSNYMSSDISPITAIEFMKEYYLENSIANATICKVLDDEESKDKEKSKDKDEEEDKNQEEIKEVSSESKDKEEPINNIDENKDGTIKKEGKIKIELGGTAVFKKDKMIGQLSLDETAYFLMINSKLNLHYTTINMDNSDVQTIVKQKDKTKISVSVKEQNPVIDIEIPLEVALIVEDSFLEEHRGIEGKKFIEEHCNIQMKERIDKYLIKTTKEYNADINNVYEYIKSKFLTTKDMNEYKFNDKYKDAKFNVVVKCNYIMMGLRSLE